MSRKLVLLATLMIVLVGTLGVAFNVQRAEASGTIHIRADGSVHPSTANITILDNTTYTFTDNIYDSIVVERSNITIDGNGRTLQGNQSGSGFILENVRNVTIKNIEIKQFGFGIYLNHSSSNSITENVFVSIAFECIRLYESSSNIIAGNDLILNDIDGITLYGSSNNNVTGNYLMSNYDGIRLYESSNNSITENIVIENYYGISLTSSLDNNIVNNNVTANHGTGISLRWSSNENRIVKNHITSNNLCGMRLNESSNNHIYHNNFVDNPEQVAIYKSTNVWDNGGEGNYWSDYAGVDLDYDGIGDTLLPHQGVDNCPLMGMFYDFTVGIGYQQFDHVHVISNSTVLNLEGVHYWLTSPNEYFQVGQPLIGLDVTEEEGGVGFCRIMIPRVVLNDSYVVLVWWEFELGAWKLVKIPSTELPISNSTHAYLYFTYIHPLVMHEITITIPEFPSFLILPLFMIATLLAVILHRRKHTG